MAVIARSASDEAISCENTDCFAEFILSAGEGLAMTALLNFTALDEGGGIAALDFPGEQAIVIMRIL